MRLDAEVDTRRVLHEAPEPRHVPLPAERLDHQIGIDADHVARVHLPIGVRQDPPERHAVCAQIDLHRLAELRRLGPRLIALEPEHQRHLRAERLHQPAALERGCVPLVGARVPIAVAAHQRILRVRSGAVRPAHRVTAGAGERIQPAAHPVVYAPQRHEVTIAEAIGVNGERVAEEAVSEPEEIGQGVEPVVDVGLHHRQVPAGLAVLHRRQPLVELLARLDLLRLVEHHLDLGGRRRRAARPGDRGRAADGERAQREDEDGEVGEGETGHAKGPRIRCYSQAW